MSENTTTEQLEQRLLDALDNPVTPENEDRVQQAVSTVPSQEALDATARQNDVVGRTEDASSSATIFDSSDR